MKKIFTLLLFISPWLFLIYSCEKIIDIDIPDRERKIVLNSLHRIDISANFHKQKKWGKRTWRIGVYNAYSRQNPFFLYFDTVFKHGEPKEVLKQVSLFPIIPSISFSFEF